VKEREGEERERVDKSLWRGTEGESRKDYSDFFRWGEKKADAGLGLWRKEERAGGLLFLI